MIWIDRLAIVWTLAAGTLLALIYPTALDGYFVEILAIVAVPPWLLLRGLRWTFTGHAL